MMNLSERLLGNYNLLKIEDGRFNVSICFRSFWINNDSKKVSLLLKVFRVEKFTRKKMVKIKR